MRILPREPWHGGQICGEQTEYGVIPGRSVFCGEFKMLNSPACETHDRELRADNYGVLPRFAEGNALGLAAYRRETMPYMFRLAWETEDTGKPEPATEEETAAWLAS